MQNIQLSDRALEMKHDLEMREIGAGDRYEAIELDPRKYKKKKRKSEKIVYYRNRYAVRKPSKPSAQALRFLPKLSSEFFEPILMNLDEDGEWMCFDELWDRLKEDDPNAGEPWVRAHLKILKAIGFVDQQEDEYRESVGRNRCVPIGTVVVSSPFKQCYLGVVVAKEKNPESDKLTIEWINYPYAKKTIIGADVALPVERWYEKTIACRDTKNGHITLTPNIQEIRTRLKIEREMKRRKKQQRYVSNRDRFFAELNHRSLTLGEVFDFFAQDSDLVLADLVRTGKIRISSGFPKKISIN